MEFPKPKLKAKRGAGFRGVPTEKEGKGTSCKCSGVLAGGSVLVQNSADITTLISNGFYGKGIFSRSVPTHLQTVDTSHHRSGSEEREDRISSKPPRKRTKVSEAVFRTDSSEEERRKKRLLLHAQWREEKEKVLASLHQNDGKGVPVLEAKEDGDEGNCNTVALSELAEPSELDLYPVAEPLCLSSEEAFFLVTEKELLTVHTPTGLNCLSTEELWTEFCAYCKRFPFTYFAYHHYRKMGWVPKSGFKFGVDFILYKDGPEFYHSSYAVLVCENYREAAEVDSTFNLSRTTAASGAGVEVQPKPDDKKPASEDTYQLKWTDVIGHCRVCESSRKELVVAYVTLSPPHNIHSPNCVQFMTLNEVLVTRWLPEKDR